MGLVQSFANFPPRVQLLSFAKQSYRPQLVFSLAQKRNIVVRLSLNYASINKTAPVLV